MFKTTFNVLAFGSTLAIASLPAANAMEFGSADAGNNNVFVTMQGKIVPGDAAKFSGFLQTLPATVSAIAMDSGGGVIDEAVRMGELIAKSNVATLLPDNATCASACFWLFAAGQHRLMVSSAQLGVHGAKDEQGREAPDSTVNAVRFAKELGIPNSIIVDMVTTPPGQIAWLTPRELTEMGVKILPPTQQMASASPPSPVYTPAPTPPPIYAPAPAPVSRPAAAATDPTQGFEQGQAERRAFEAWIATLPEGSQFKDGALYWASVRSTKKAAIGCVGPGYTGKPEEKEWAAGCLNAKAKLDPTDYRRLTNASYREGWNSVPDTENDVPPRTSAPAADWALGR